MVICGLVTVQDSSRNWEGNHPLTRSNLVSDHLQNDFIELFGSILTGVSNLGEFFQAILTKSKKFF